MLRLRRHALLILMLDTYVREKCPPDWVHVILDMPSVNTIIIMAGNLLGVFMFGSLLTFRAELYLAFWLPS